MAKINLNTILEDDKNVVERITETVEVAQQPLPNFDAILMEWSWRCEKGYPDFNNKKDIAVLKEVLNEMNLSVPNSIIIEAPGKKSEDSEKAEEVEVKDTISVKELAKTLLSGKFNGVVDEPLK